MDTKLIREYGADILCYRFPSARQKKRMQYEDFDKRLIQLDREESNLFYQIHHLGWEPLVPPVQKGWKRCFVLRQDVARSKQADFFEKILSKINTCHWSYRKDFKIRKRRMGRKYYIVKPQFLNWFYEHEMKKMAFSEAERRYFHEVWQFDGKKRFIKRYVFSEPWRFVLKVSPNIIDKVKIRDEVLEARKHEIRSWFERNAYNYRRNRLLDQNCAWWRNKGEPYRGKYLLRNKTMQEILETAKEEFFEYRVSVV